MTKQTGEYYLGLDIGTNSVGWAVTDPDYNILEYRRKATWGIHLFDEGKTSEDRRMHRCARRRLNRRKQRVTLLRELLSPEVCKVDPSFFDRLDESGLFMEDRKDKQMNSLFNDVGFDDAAYHRKFPTIYHLRRYLMRTDDKPDIRLVYLAAHHIVKYRGHFLYGNLGDDAIPSFEDAFKSLSDILSDQLDMELTFDPTIADILCDRNLRITDKRKVLAEKMGCFTSSENELAKLLAGSKIKLDVLFNDESLKGESISFKDSDADEKIDMLNESIEQDYVQVIRRAKSLYDWSILSSILSGFSTISDAKVAQYEQHMNDLVLLKKTVRTYAPDKYKLMFKDPKTIGNYCSYVGVCGNGKPDKSCSQEDFCKFCHNLLSKTEAVNDGSLEGMMARLADFSFMPKQTTKENSVLPYSVHRKELKAILDNVSRFYPFLSEIGDDGFSVAEKILMIQEFRVPYYVGPIGKGSPNSWSVRRSDERVTPWNFGKVIDEDACAEAFMDNLTNYCSYMVGEKVLPKNSILYSYFQVYNEMNNLKVGGEKLPVDVKKKLIDDLFVKKVRSVTKKSIKTYLKSEGFIDAKDDPAITGIDDTVKANLKPLSMMRKAIGDKADDRGLCESVIRIITVFGDEKRIRIKLKSEFGDRLDDDEIRSLSKLSFEGWGRLSERFLTGLYDTCRETGEQTNIMGLLENTSDNLMEIYHKYSFKEQVDRFNSDMTADTEMDYGMLDRMYMSPAVKRGVWRTISVVRDIVECMGHNPSKVFVETTRDVRGVNDNRRTESRKNNLMQLYKACREDPQWITDLDGKEEADLKSRSMYLYYTQLGRCMYCGRRIDFDELKNTDSVDRDHIFPQSKVKDDSIHNNMVLSCKLCNGSKSNMYPIPAEWQQRMKPYWTELRDKGYISVEKYSRLVRTTPFSEDELNRFISRQLVETSQSVKSSLEIMKRLFGDDTDLVYVRGGLVSEFRQEMGFVKCRSVNDYHHAKDAYLNIVVGNVYDVKFTKDISRFLKSGDSYNIAKMYDRPVSRNGYTAWTPGEDGTAATVRKYMRRDNILFTKYQYISHGQLFDDNLLRAKDTLFDRKSDRPSGKYGGYDNEKGACYSLVEYQSKKEIVRSFEFLPIHHIQLLEDPVALRIYYSERIGKDVTVVVPVVRMNALIEWDGYRMNIGGRTGSSIVFYPAVQLILPDDQYSYCKKLYTFDEDRKQKTLRPMNYYGINKDANIALFDTLYDKCDVKPFSKVMGSLKKNLDAVRNDFMDSDESLQAEVLNEVLHAFQCNALTTGLKKVKGVGLTGRIVISSKLPRGRGRFFIVNQSVSGLNENKILLSQ